MYIAKKRSSNRSNKIVMYIFSRGFFIPWDSVLNARIIWIYHNNSKWTGNFRPNHLNTYDTFHKQNFDKRFQWSWYMYAFAYITIMHLQKEDEKLISFLSWNVWLLAHPKSIHGKYWKMCHFIYMLGRNVWIQYR